MRPMFNPKFDWSKVEREEIAYGTTRGLRLTRVGMVFFVEAAHVARDEARWRMCAEKIEWKVTAVAKGPDPVESYFEALDFLIQANEQVAEIIARDSGQHGEDRGGIVPRRSSPMLEGT